MPTANLIIMSSRLIHRGDSLSFTATNEYAIKTLNCPAYEDCDLQATYKDCDLQAASEDHTYECILFHPEDNSQMDSNDPYVID